MARAMNAFWSLLRSDPRLIGFALLFCFGSSLGQTFLFSFFVPSFRESFGLGAGEIATIYMAITIAAAGGLALIGKHIDRMDILAFSGLTVAVLAAGCFLLAGSWGVIPLVLAMFLTRLGGQGLMSHVGMTSVARYFTARRGTAIALAALGFPLGEILLPLPAVAGIETIGWRATYAIGGLGLTGLLALAAWLVRDQERFRDPVKADTRAKARGETLPDPEDDAGPGAQSRMTARELYRSPRFLLLVPAYVAAPLSVTALIFHQSAIADARGLQIGLFAASFALFGAMQVIFGTLSGPVIDRLTARALFPFHLFAFIAGAAFFAMFAGAWAVPVYMALLGVSSGISATLRTAVVAEMVRPLELGAARSMLTALMVLSTALGPPIYGWALALGAGVEALLWGTSVFMIAASAIAALSLRPGRKRLASRADGR